MAGKTVLCIADQKSLLDSRKRELQSSGFSVLTASSSKDAVTIFTSQPVDAVVLDCAEPDIECGNAPAPIKKLNPRTPVILLSPKPPLEDLSSIVDVFIPKEQDDPSMLSSRLNSLINLRSHNHPELQKEYVIFADSSRRYLDCSDGICQLLGYDRMELIGMTIDDVSFSPDRTPGLFEKFLKRGEQDGEYVLRHKSGRPVLITYHSYAFADGCLAAVWEPVKGWRELYSAALVEADSEKLKERVAVAHAAIELRMNELAETNQRNSAEWRAIQDAVSGLAMLRREFTE